MGSGNGSHAPCLRPLDVLRARVLVEMFPPPTLTKVGGLSER